MPRARAQETLNSVLSWLELLLMVIILFLEGTKLKPKDLTTCLGLWPNTMTDEIKP